SLVLTYSISILIVLEGHSHAESFLDCQARCFTISTTSIHIPLPTTNIHFPVNIPTSACIENGSIFMSNKSWAAQPRKPMIHYVEDLWQKDEKYISIEELD